MLDFKVTGTLLGYKKTEGLTYITVEPSFAMANLPKGDKQAPFNFALDEKLKISDLPLEQEAIFHGNFARCLRSWENPSTNKVKDIENIRFRVTKIELVKKIASPV